MSDDVACGEAEWPTQLPCLLANVRMNLIEAALALFGDILLQGVELLGGELGEVDAAGIRSIVFSYCRVKARV